MPDVISGVIIAPRNLRYYCLAMAKIDKNPETSKKKGKKLRKTCKIGDILVILSPICTF